MSSMIFRYPPLHSVLSALEVSEVVTDCCAFQTKKFGERHLKQFKVVFTGGDWGLRIRRKCKCPGGEHVALMRRSEDGKVSGTKLLKESQAYPPKFGEAVVAAWLDLEKAAEEADGKKTSKKRPAASQASHEKPSWTQPPPPPRATTSAGKRTRTFSSATAEGAVKPSWMRPL